MSIMFFLIVGSTMVKMMVPVAALLKSGVGVALSVAAIRRVDSDLLEPNWSANMQGELRVLNIV